jgi:prephenate dehydrogenase
VNGRILFRKAVIVGGGGAVGRLLAGGLLASGTRELLLVDPRPAVPPTGATAIEDDIGRPSAATLRALQDSNLVILATPEPVAVHAAALLLPAMKPGSLLVDTLSVKSRFAAAVAGVATQAELLGINPMFAPSLGFTGRSVVAVPYASGPAAEGFMEFIARQGSEVVRLDAEQHDRVCAALQVATHAVILSFGLALQASGYQVSAAEAVAPPPHRTLLALLARILSADPEVYRDIQSANPFAAGMRADLLEALRRLDEIVATDDPHQFAALIEGLRGLFSGADVDYARLCARLFEVAPGD